MKLNKNLMKNLTLFFATVLFITACKKDSGAYNFENQVNEYDGNLYEYLKSQPGVYDSLLKVADRVSWFKDSLRTDANFTLFAPTNRSFTIALLNLNNVRVADKRPKINLGTAKLEQLDTMLNRYLIRGKYTTDSLLLTDGAILGTSRYNYEMHGMEVNSNAYGFVKGGPKTIMYSDMKGSQYIVQWQRTTTQAVNIFTKNAVVHVLNPAHEFGFSEFTQRLNQ